MKKALLLVMMSCLALPSFSQTFVPGGLVNGPWTAAGSPYIVQGDIFCNTLVIQAGVDVRFANHSGLTVYQSIKAYGTAAAPVIFESDDTTGWSNLSSVAGGHKGIYIPGNGLDTSIFDHVIFKDAKGIISDVWAVGLVSGTGLFVLTNSEVYHNYVSGTSYVMSVNGGSPIVDSNYVHDNFGRQSTLALWDSQGLIKDNEFARNRGGQGGAIYAVNNSASQGPLITNNDFHHNRADFDGGAIFVGTGKARIVRNNIVYNHSHRAGSGIYVMYAPVTIISNLICNNADSTNNPCGITDGGGGIMINGDGDSAIIQNNVIANNSCYFRGGGVRVSGYAAVIIENNNIVRNNSYFGFFTGGIDISDNSDGAIRNNILWGNRARNQFGQTDTGQVYIGANDTFALEFNFAETSYYGSMVYNVNTQITGNQFSNIAMFNTNPGFVGATSGDGWLYDATVADWHLTWGSPCINNGVLSTIAVNPQPVDFYGDQRVWGANIDIGAVEYPMENGIEENSASQIHIFPNPTSDVIRIFNCEMNAEVTIIDAVGHVVRSVRWNGDAIDVADFPAGIYFVSIRQLEKVTTSRFIKD